MKKSPLQIARAAYQPKMPASITGNPVIVEGKATESVADQADIKKLFPNTYGLPIVTFENGDKAAAAKAINVGVILSGGQAPGGHNVISGIFDGIKAINPDSKLYGFL
ncbi:MAG: diphosphate--fructose-6-phosphate 1-phosphotransferase, partial [Bacteroidales bacterium]|nr:diphosphate--fructose-6-phosphate 1-phosphotransferase [Bacteroidales bacterium]